MQVDAPHIFIVMVMVMAMVMAVARMVMLLTVRMPMAMLMSMVMPVMMVSKRHHANQIHSQAKAANNKELAKPLCLRPFPQSLECFKRNFNTEEPKPNSWVRIMIIGASYVVW